jgi:Trk K+ transport system NAD-binding subunit
MSEDRAPILIAGDDGVPVRVREELAGAGVPTVAVCSSRSTIAGRAAAAAGAKLVIGDLRTAETWEAAGAATARSIGLLDGDDLTNLSAALLVAEHNPGMRLVVRVFSGDLTAGIEQLLGGRATALSEIEVAAPAFVQAALSGNTGQRVTVAGHVLEVAAVDRGDPSLVVALANAETPTDVLPAGDALADHVLGLVDSSSVVTGARGALPATAARHRLDRATAPEGPEPRRRPRVRSLLGLVPPRAWILLAVIGVAASASTAVFALGAHLRLVDAAYFTAATMATVGYGDINLSASADWLKVYDIGLMAVSAVLLASTLALITEALVSTRIDRALGRFPRPREDHVVVCGLGKAGAKILAQLDDLGVPCVGIEQHTEAVGIAVARRREIPVVFADIRAPGTFEPLHLDGARALMAVTNDDLANLQCGLAAREVCPDLRIVTRMFDRDLAERLDHAVHELGLTRSVSALAAPAFSAALLGRPLVAPLPLSNVPLRVVETTVDGGSPFAGRMVGEVNRGDELRVLALDGRWRPRGDIVLEPGMAIGVVGTLAACETLAG